MDYTFNFWLAVIIIFALGSLFHFVYDWSHQNKIVGLFGAVNESTWEHVKIALTATFLWSFYDGFFYGAMPNYFFAKLFCLLTIVIAIPLIFYVYQAITKKDILLLDIATFFIAILFSQLVFYVILTLPSQPFAINYLACIGVFIFFGCYMTLTLEPIKNFLFKDPITGKYGFYAHRNLKHKIKNRKKSTKKS